jgi:uncharacterized protein YndB with AHSA1/START domain
MTDVDIVTVEIELPVPPEEVFPYWTDPDSYTLWMGNSVRLDAIPGGEYIVEMNDGFAAMGSFLQIERPHRVEFSWGWAPGAGKEILTGPQPDDLLPPGTSRVIVTLDNTQNQTGTALRLEHHDLSDETLRANHLLTWQTYLARLAVVVQGGDPGPEPHA